ncbi:hypothetical protein MY11210_004734 [Beauveria gryllotalpidicola]
MEKQSNISSVEELRSYWNALAPEIASTVDEVLEIPIDRQFDPHIHEDAIRNFLPRFDCYAKRSNRKMLVRMPLRIHEGFIASIEQEFYRQLDQSPTQDSKVEIGRSSRVLLYDGEQSRQPDTQFLDSKGIPRVIVEVAYTQSGRHSRNLAEDYIFGTNGQVKRVFVCHLNPVGKSSMISEWEGKITESDDPNYEEDLSVALVQSKEFRTADGASVNDDERFNIPCCDFAARSDGRNVISIQFRHFYDTLGKLEMKRVHT